MTAVAAMTRFIAERFREPLLVEQIAGAAHLSGAYAMTLFRHHVGSTISGYISRCRVAEAQRLLLTTSRPTAEIGYAAGFGSQSAFYEQFTRASGTSPGRYRRAIAARSSR
jgi:AraC-like DNA-binding protein